MTARNNFDVIIIGGSYAGLSAAMALGRSLRRVLILDNGLPCNRQTPHSHNFLTQDGERPAAIAQKAKAQVLQYPTVQFEHDMALSASKTEAGFTVSAQSGAVYRGKKLILAAGIKDIMPEIEGFAECWGISVIHCPYCHGYEFRNKPTAIIASAERAMHLLPLVSNLSDKVTLLSPEASAFNEDLLAKLRKRGIEVIEEPLKEIKHNNGKLTSLILAKGRELSFEAVYAAIPFTQHSDIPAALGCQLSETGHIKVDTLQKTSVEGVYACGDSSSGMRSVASAVYTGNLAGAMVNKDLADEEF